MTLPISFSRHLPTHPNPTRLALQNVFISEHSYLLDVQTTLDFYQMDTFANTLCNERVTCAQVSAAISLEDSGLDAWGAFFSGGIDLGVNSYLILTAEVVSDLHVNGF